MGALRGSIAVRRYTVPAPLPADARKRFVKGLRAHRFLPLDPKAELDSTTGWVSILDGEDAEIAQEKVFFVAAGGEQLRVALRTDVLKAPAAEVRRQLLVRVAEAEAKDGRPLGRREKRLLKEEVARTLRLRAFPKVRITDMVWDLDGKRLYFWSQSKGANEGFVELFAKTFDMKLEEEGAAFWANELADPKKVGKLEPTRELWMGFAGVRPLMTGGTEGTEGNDGA